MGKPSTEITLQTASNVLLSIAGLIVAFLALVFALMAAGNEAAMWIGGWGLLFLGIPILVVLLTCLFVGLALRARTNGPEVDMAAARVAAASAKPGPRFALEWAAIAIGGVLLAVIALEMASVYFSSFSPIRGLGETDRSFVGLLLMVTFLDLKLPIALGLLAFGVARLRTRKRAEPA